MKLTPKDLLYAISPDKDHPLVMTDDEIMLALPLPINDMRRDWLMQRYGLCGWESMSLNQIAKKHQVGVGRVTGGINRAVDILRRHIKAGLGAVNLSEPPTRNSLISDLPLNRRILRRCDREGWVWLGDLQGVSEGYLLRYGHIGRKLLEELRTICKTAGVRIVPKFFEASPDEPLAGILSQNSLEIIEPTGAKVLSDLVPIVKGEYDPENRLWQISDQDLGVAFHCLAAAGLLK